MPRWLDSQGEPERLSHCSLRGGTADYTGVDCRRYGPRTPASVIKGTQSDPDKVSAPVGTLRLAEVGEVIGHRQCTTNGHVEMRSMTRGIKETYTKAAAGASRQGSTLEHPNACKFVMTGQFCKTSTV